MTGKTKPCDRAQAAARLAIARSFLEAAELTEAGAVSGPYTGNASVTNWVQAGIAAADAICCAELREHAVGDSHADASALVRRVHDGAVLARDLATLLGLKSASAYGASPMKSDDVARARRAAERLVAAARDRLRS